MRVPVLTRRPPTLLEQVLGRQRARTLRRRMGLLCLGAGATLLRPRSPVLPLLATCTVVLLASAALLLR